MPRRVDPLTDLQIRKAKPAEKTYRLSDGKGMYLEIAPTGSKYWRMKYLFDGKEKRAAFGVYPEVSLSDARAKCLEARKMLADGIDPGEHKKDQKRTRVIEATSSFRIVATEWFENQKDAWSEGYADKVLKSLQIDVFPHIGDRPLSDINAPQMLELVRRVESRGVRETAKRILQRSNAVFQYGIMTGRCTRNPAAEIDAETILKRSAGVQHMARVKALEIPKLMQDIAAYDGEVVTRLALQFMALTFVRTKEMIEMDWAEVDEKAAEWRIPAERMKMRDPHIVPLSRQALAVLAQLREFNSASRHVFHSVHGRKPISNNTMLYALYRMGYKSRMTGHGFRGLAATVLRELGYSRDIVDRQLAYAERNQVTAAYVHAEYLPERTRMMQHWGDYIDAAAAPNV
jgi:integrase